MADVELLPCPFCGGTEIHIGPMDPPSAWECWVVGCNNYDCPLDADSVKVELGTPEKAAAAWNTRATDANLAPLQAENERLRAEVAEWKRVAAAQAELRGEAEERAERLAKEIDWIKFQSEDDRMFAEIEAAAKASFHRFRTSCRGQILTRADNYESHLVWATLEWAKRTNGAEQRAEWLAEALRELVDVLSESGMYDEEVFANARAALAKENE